MFAIPPQKKMIPLSKMIKQENITLLERPIPLKLSRFPKPRNNTDIIKN